MFKDSKAFSGFSVDNLEKARVFYTKTLGIPVTQQKEGLFLHISGGNPIFVYEKKENHIPATYTILNFPVDNIDIAVDTLRSLGVVFEHYEGMTDEKGIARGIESGMGPDIAWFKDPAGNYLSVLKTT